jgi:hypothetical protein
VPETNRANELPGQRRRDTIAAKNHNPVKRISRETIRNDASARKQFCDLSPLFLSDDPILLNLALKLGL